MCPQSVITSCYTEAGEVVVDNGEEGCLPFQRCPDGSDQTSDRYADDQTDIQPVDMLPPICSCHLGVCDVWFSWVIALISVGL